jgi:hypothetical protein
MTGTSRIAPFSTRKIRKKCTLGVCLRKHPGLPDDTIYTVSHFSGGKRAK